MADSDYTVAVVLQASDEGMSSTLKGTSKNIEDVSTKAATAQINFVSMMLNKNYSRRKIILNKLAVELKSSFNYSTDQMRNDFPFNIIRFSKYCEAINSLIKV